MPKDNLDHQDPETNQVEFHTPRLSKQKYGLVQDALTQLVVQAMSMREVMDFNLEQYSALYDMQVGQKDFPWPNSSNVFVPMVPININNAVSRTMQQVMVSRLFLAKGETADAERHSHEVEKWYNHQIGKRAWDDAVFQYDLLGERDGTGIMEVLWEKKIHVAKMEVEETELDDNQQPLIDLEGNPQTKMVIQDTPIEEYNFVRWRPVELRDFYLFPSWATSIEEAHSVGRVLYLSEADLRAMVKSKTLSANRVEYVIATQTEQELPMDEHLQSYTIGGQIDVSTEDVTENGFSTKESCKVWRIHSRKFDLNGDGIPEENVFYYHEFTETLLGWHHYQYAHGKRPYVPFCPDERPNRFYGYSSCERMKGLQIELNALHNQRRDEIDLRLSPPLLRKAGAALSDQSTQMRQWGPATVWDVTEKDDVTVMEMPPLSGDSYNVETMLIQYGKEVMGVSETPTGGRATKAAVQQASAELTIRQALKAGRLQRALKEIYRQTHALVIQYAPDQPEDAPIIQIQAPQQQQMPGQPPGQPQQPQMQQVAFKQILRLPYELNINGMGAPLDRQTRRQELLFLMGQLLQNPLVKSSMPRVFALTRRLLEEFEIEDTISIIGTEDDAAQMQKQMQDQQALMQKIEIARLAQGGQPRQDGQQQSQGGGNRQARRQQGASR